MNGVVGTGTGKEQPRPGRTRRDVIRDAAGWAAVAPLLTRSAHAAVTASRHPYVQHVLTNRATICWATREAGADATVEVAADPGFASPLQIAARSRRIEPAESRMPNAFTQWEADVTGLSPGTRYYYRAMVGNESVAPADSDLSFRTAPGSGPFRFLALGDSGGNTPQQFALRNQMLLEQGAALAIHTGDIAYPFGSHQTYESYYLQVYRDLMKQIPFYPVAGNHDVELDGGAPYLAIHDLPVLGVPDADRKRYYSFDWGDVHFVSLDSNLMPDAVRGRRMLDWLNADLQATRKQWKIVCWHHTPYDGARGHEPEARLAREMFVPVIERHGVQLVLAGHSHIYERSHPLLRGERVTGAGPGVEGIVYVTTGGAGGGLHPLTVSPQAAVSESADHYLRVEVDRTRLTVRAMGVGGREVDRFVIAPRPMLTRESTVNAASFLPPVAPGSLITIFGRNLAPEDAFASGLPLPAELAGVRVALGGSHLPLTFVSPGQITAQLPFKSEGPAALRLTTPNGVVEIPFRVQMVAPGIFETPNGPAVVRADGRIATGANAVRAGEAVSIYLTGLGDIRGELQAGSPAPAAPLLEVLARVEVEVGGLLAAPLFAGLTPGQAGVYQINVRIPEGVAPGRRVLAVTASGVRSNEVTIDVAA